VTKNKVFTNLAGTHGKTANHESIETQLAHIIYTYSHLFRVINGPTTTSETVQLKVRL
jgi:hypothetical protein